VTALAALTPLGVARAGAFAVLVLLLALAVRRWAAGRGDAVDSGPVALAAAASLLVAAGLALSVVNGVTAVGWLVVLLGVDVALLAPRESRDLARRALPAAIGVLAAVVAVGAVALSRASAQRHDRAVRFTQLWIVPDNHAGGTVAHMGVRNFEGGPRSYRVVVTGMRRTLAERTVQLPRGAAWTAALPLPLTDSPKKVTAELFRSGDRAPYRTASTWTATVP
jgi:hypothetical protein